jgi:hypothetical protein
MVEAALRGVMREALARVATQGLPGAHHIYITFRTRFPGVVLPEHIARQNPDSMTIVLQYQFWNLEVSEHCFSVTLSFQSKHERLAVPFEAITTFFDPSVKFALQFPPMADAESPPPLAEPVADEEKPGEVVALDAFRKK